MGRGRRVFTPQPTIDFEDAVLAHWQKLGKPQSQGPVKVTIRLKKEHFLVSICELSGRKAAVRGDVDNYAKAILDGLQKGDSGAFKDDRQVYELVVSKDIKL